ncbi:MAG: hypothetical protein Q8K81_07925 [Sulfuricurvum sp.]|nr:hypothetical protein [Sulfuricurvum sp.]
MIKLIALLFIISTADADIFPFLLPDEKSQFNYHLQSHLKKANKEIVILTSSMNFPSLRKTLTGTLSHGVHLTLIVREPLGDPLYFTAYRGVDLYTYRPRNLSDTLILIDNIYVCHLSGPLNEKHLSDDTSSVWCSDEASHLLRTKKHLDTLLQRSRGYLQ